MRQGNVVVLDVGKTLAKLTMWTRDGRLVERRMRPNDACREHDYPCLDLHGIEAWLSATLREFTKLGEI